MCYRVPLGVLFGLNHDFDSNFDFTLFTGYNAKLFKILKIILGHVI